MYMKHVISDVFAFRTEIVSWNQLKLAQLPDCVASITSLQAGLGTHCIFSYYVRSSLLE